LRYNEGSVQNAERVVPEGEPAVTQLTSLRLAGWKSIRDSEEIQLRPLNVLIKSFFMGAARADGEFMASTPEE